MNEPNVSNEQKFYDLLKEQPTKTLIKRAKQIEHFRHNFEIELNMIRNLLINRKENVPDFFETDMEYGRFYNPEQQKPKGQRPKGVLP